MLLMIGTSVVAWQWWGDYFVLGQITDGKHSLTFHGVSAYGHLLGVSMGLIVATVLAVRAIKRFIALRGRRQQS